MQRYNFISYYLIGLRYLCIHKSNENGNNMENFSELIKNRRSMRKFTDEELTQDEVVALMKAALMSPSSKRSNSWQFVVVDDKEKLKELSHCKEQASSFIADAALAIVVMADPLASDVWIEDASDCFHHDTVAGGRFGAGKLLGTGSRTFHCNRNAV